jgi:Na+/melibiose symporter-like transporter
MFAAPAPLVLTIYAIFNPPGGLDSTGLFLWFAIFTVGMRICLTLFAVPHLAMGAELSDDYNERSKVMSYNNVFTYLRVLFMHVVVWWVIFPAFDNGRTNQDCYLPFVFFCCSLIVVSILSSAYMTLDQLPRMKKIPEDLPPFSFLQLFREMWSAISNRHYLFLLLGFFFLAVTIGTHETLGLYMGTFYWEFTDYQMGWLIMSNVFGYTLGFMGAARLHSWIDKRASIVLTAAGLSVFWSMAVTLRLFDLAPANTTWQLVTFVIFWGTFSSACGSILNISVMSALADIADEHELKTGRRQEGIFYSARTFFAKSTNGVGHIVAGIALDAIEFPTGAVPGSVDADKIFALGVIDGPFAMVWGLVAACFYAGYRINRKYHEDIQRQLAERAAASQAQEKP